MSEALMFRRMEFYVLKKEYHPQFLFIPFITIHLILRNYDCSELNQDPNSRVLAVATFHVSSFRRLFQKFFAA